METGKPYNVAVTMVNNGETTWTRAQQYTLMSFWRITMNGGASTALLYRSITSRPGKARPSLSR